MRTNCETRKGQVLLYFTLLYFTLLCFTYACVCTQLNGSPPATTRMYFSNTDESMVGASPTYLTFASKKSSPHSSLTVLVGMHLKLGTPSFFLPSFLPSFLHLFISGLFAVVPFSRGWLLCSFLLPPALAVIASFKKLCMHRSTTLSSPHWHIDSSYLGILNEVLRYKVVW